MGRFLLAACAFLLWAMPAAAQQFTALTYVPLGYQQISTVSSSTALTVPTGAKYAVIVSEAQAVRYRDDGVAPTAAIGMPLAVGERLIYSGRLSAIRFFEQTGGAKLNISYYR